MKEIDFGFLFCRVMSFYHQDYMTLMQMPMKTFWLLSQNIERVAATQDLRSLSVALAGQGGEHTKEFQERLILEMGTCVVEETATAEVRDEAGFQELKQMSM